MNKYITAGFFIAMIFNAQTSFAHGDDRAESREGKSHKGMMGGKEHKGMMRGKEHMGMMGGKEHKRVMGGKEHMGMMGGKEHMRMMGGKKHMGMMVHEKMKERAEMMSKCADELEKDNPDPKMMKQCAAMLRKQSNMMENCMQNDCKMMHKKSAPE